MRTTLFLAVLSAVPACGARRVTPAQLDEAAAALDFGDDDSSALTTKAWQALATKDYLAVLATTREVISRYGAQGRAMNAALDDFATAQDAAQYWALNDVGSSLFIQAEAYVALRQFDQAADALDDLKTNYGFSQCWDPQGWYWHPAHDLSDRIRTYRSK